jgi:hypothetical protein
VSFWLGADGLGQIEGLLTKRVDVLYPAEGRLCRARVSADELALWQDAHPLLFAVFNPFARGVLRRPRVKEYRVVPGRARVPGVAGWARRRAAS